MKHRLPPPSGRSARAALALVLVLTSAPAAFAQKGFPIQPADNSDRDYPRWVGHFTILSGNALVGGLTAGISQRLRGGSFRDGFARGALGGVVVYAGKRVAAERFDGAGLVGRQVGALGASIVRNASEARPSLDRLFVPLGPVHLHLDPGSGNVVRARLDLANAIWTGWAIAESRLDFDLGASLSAGAPVFRAEEVLLQNGRRGEKASGLSAAGAVLLGEIEAWGEEHHVRTFAHERVHVIQDDFMFYVASHPVELWLFDRVPRGAGVGRFFDLNLGSNLQGMLSLAFKNYHNRPWEMEAQYLERR